MNSIASLRQSLGSARSIHTSRNSDRTPHRPPHHPHRLIDALEPRTLLYTPSTIINTAEDAFAYLISTIEAQTGGEVAGFGRTVVNIGDINADGADDLAIGAPGGGSAVGLVQLFSGKTGTLLWTAAGADIGFGRAITAITDATSDGVADIAIGSPLHDATGAVFIYNGATGALVSTILGSTFNAISGARFGWSLATGLFNPDQTEDLAIGAPTDGEDGKGRVYLVNGPNYDTAVAWAGIRAGELYGWSLLGIGEGNSTLVIGSPGYPTLNHAYTNIGRVSILTYSGPREDFMGSADGAMLGYSLAALPPEQFGVPRFAVGAPSERLRIGDDLGMNNIGVVAIFHLSGNPLRPDHSLTSAETGSLFGYSLATIGDLILVGAPGSAGGGKVYLHNIPTGDYNHPGITSTLVDTITATGTNFGITIAVGDFNADHLADTAIASGLVPLGVNTSPSETSSGTVRVYSATLDPSDLDQIHVSRDARYTILRSTSAGAYYLAGPTGLSLIPDISTSSADRFVDIDNTGRVLISRSGAAWLFSAGTLTNLSAAITTYVGTPDGWTFDSAMTPRAILADGSVLVERLRNNSGTPNQLVNRTIWRLDATTATYLWQGEYLAHSTYGALGRRLDSYNADTNDRSWTTMLYRVGTGLEEIASIQNAAAITDDGVIVGVDYATNSFVKRTTDATLTTLFAVLDAEYADTLWPKALDSDGRLLWFQAEDKSKYAGEHWYWIIGTLRLYDPQSGTSSDAADGAIPTYRTTFGASTISTTVSFTSSHGFVVSNPDPYNPVGVHYFKAGFDSRLTTPAPGATPATASGSTWTATAFVNQLGRITLAIDEGDGQWKLRYAAYSDDFFSGDSALIGWVDPLTNRPQFAGVSTRFAIVHIASFPEFDGLTTRKPYLLWETRPAQLTRSDGSSIDSDAYPDFINNMVVLVRPDNLNILAVQNDFGELYLIGQVQNTIHNPFSFTYLYNLTNELSIRHNPAPHFQGAISAFVSPWGSHNITGVDADGHVWTLWTSPEFVGWQSTDLTAWIGAEPFAGNVTSFITTWNAFNMTGLDNSGRLTTLWWAPELGPGNWEVSFIGEGQTAWDTSVAIDSWFNQSTQSLNFVGTNESGRVTVYTWSVSNQTWRAEYPENDVTAQPVHRFAPDRYSQKSSRLVGINDADHIIWAYRDPNAWISYDLLMLLE
ncbi:MAG: integrin alpha [Phycisphaerales bacterium]